jgi:predicted RNase H-like HicB family nuclease
MAREMSNLRYEMVIVWSEEDDCYQVHLPDFPKQTYRTHGDSYEEAARNGEEVLQLLLEEDGLPLPKPRPSAAY